MRRGKGVTLIELILVVSILAIMVVMLSSVLNPTALVSKANDSKRKKDLGRIKVSFEDYFNDKGCYPNLDIINLLTDKDNCGKDVFTPWLRDWPCDPEKRTPYVIAVEDSSCPSWYKVAANLLNRSDGDIPPNWYENGQAYRVIGGMCGVEDVNYGVSSPNVSWYERELAPWCESVCYAGVSGTGGYCTLASEDGCFSGNCFMHRGCLRECQVSSCEN